LYACCSAIHATPSGVGMPSAAAQVAIRFPSTSNASYHIRSSRVREARRAELQPEVGAGGYDASARSRRVLLPRNLALYAEEADLDPPGRPIIECGPSGGEVEDNQTPFGATN